MRRLRWSFGWIKVGDLSGRSDADLVGLAEEFVRRGKSSRALVVLGAFSQRTTMDPRILQRYGDVSRALGSHDSAIFSYLQAAELHLQGGMTSKASALLLQLVRVYPEHVDARLALARVLESMQRNKEAAANYAVVARIFEAHGQHEACGPLMAKIAELWPMARADYQGPPVLPAATSAAPVVVGEPTPAADLSGPIELDLQSLISTFALSGDAPPAVHQAATVSVGSYDPNLLAAAGHEPSTVCVPDDPWLGNRPPIPAGPSQAEYSGTPETGYTAPITAYNDAPTAAYQAIDGNAVEVDRTLMDLRAIDLDTNREHATVDATILDLRAIRDEPPSGAARVIDLTETEQDPAPRAPVKTPPRRGLTSLKRTTL